MAQKRNQKGKKSRRQHDEQVRRDVADLDETRWTEGVPLSPSWWAPAFSAILIVGLVWLVVFYLSAGRFPIPAIGNWNILVGISIMLVGFGMTLKWR